jgi:tricorn protease
LLDLETGARKIISLNRQGVGGISWSPDSQWIAFQQNAVNSYAQIYLYGLVNGEATSVTSDRVNSWSPAWGARGDWLYFVSDRSLQSLVGSPWGARQPEPYFDKSEKIYQIALRPDVRSPFRPKDELIKPDEIKNGEAQAEEKDGTTEKPEVEKLAIDLAGIQRRVRELPAKRGNIYNLSANDGFLFWQERDSGPDAKSHLKVMQITNEKPESKTLIENVTFYDLSDDGKKILVRVEKDLYVIDAQKDAPPKLVDHKLALI